MFVNNWKSLETTSSQSEIKKKKKFSFDCNRKANLSFGQPSLFRLPISGRKFFCMKRLSYTSRAAKEQVPYVEDCAFQRVFH